MTKKELEEIRKLLKTPQIKQSYYLNDLFESSQTLLSEVERLQHSGMFINCVYCGYRYDPSDSTPASMASW